uniref:C2 domain-containing protein n=1 Tax=Setaria italica TaxID=4555 RepID=K3Y567_SETIT
MTSTSAPASACRVTPARSTASFLPARSLAGCRAVVWRCWSARRGRRRRWAALRARCVGGQSSAVQPDSGSAGEGLVAEEDGPRRPPFDLNLAVVLAGFAFEAYTSPPADVGWRETDAADCQTVFLSDVFLREVYDGQLVVKLKKGINLPAMDPWGTSDPYVILQLNGQTARSNIKWATKEPTWNESFTFNIRKSRENLLQVAAWDANLVTPHKRMGNAGLYLESLCDGNSHNVTVELEGLGGGGTIEIEVKYKSYDDIEREKQWWRIPFVSDFLVKSSLGSALRTVLGSESINASQFVQSAFGQLSSFTYTYLPKPSSLESGGEVSESVEEPRDNAVESNNLQQQKIDSGDSLDSHCEAQSPAAAVNSEGDVSSDEYFWRALNNVLNQNVLQNFGFSLPEVKKLDGFDLLSSLGLKSREIAEQKYLESGLATTDTSTSDGSETTPEDSVGVDNENGALTTKEEDQSSFLDINKVSRDVLSQTENILGALMILSKNLSPHDNKSVTTNETNKKDDMIIEQEVAAAEDSIDKDNTVASTKLSVDAQKAEDMRHLFASAETAMEAWAMLATSLGRNSFIKSDFEKICFLDNVSTDTQIISTNVFRLPFGAILHEEGYGFLGAYDSVRNRIMALIKFAVGYQDEEDAENIPRWHVYVTGHSLGGALATLLALELSSSQMAKNGVIFVTMYNFGSPRVGNRRFAEVYNAKVKDSWRIVNHRDIIPTVPRLMGYCHVEAPVYLKFGDSKDELVNNGILDDEDQGDVIGEYTPDVLVTEFMKGEKQLVEKLLQTEINLLRSIRDGSALMQHMEDFYYVTLLENVRSRYQVVDSAIDESHQLTA